MLVVRSLFPRFEVRKGGKGEAWAKQANGQNGIWRVWIWSGIDCAAAVGAQELYEWRWRTKVGGLAASVAGLAFVALGVLVHSNFFWGAPLAAWAAFVLFPRFHPAQRRKELMSHEVEVQAAALLYGADKDDLRAREAKGMTGYAWLKKMSEAEIGREMNSRSLDAHRWVKANQSFLERVATAAYNA